MGPIQSHIDRVPPARLLLRLPPCPAPPCELWDLFSPIGALQWPSLCRPHCAVPAPVDGDRVLVDVLEVPRAKAGMHVLTADEARVQHWEAQVKPGDCFMSDPGEGLPVFGEVLKGYPEGRLQHCRFRRCYSVACPEGELGDVHVSTIRCLGSRALFERLKEQGWQLSASPRLVLPEGLKPGDGPDARGRPWRLRGPSSCGRRLRVPGPLGHVTEYLTPR